MRLHRKVENEKGCSHKCGASHFDYDWFQNYAASSGFFCFQQVQTALREQNLLESLEWLRWKPNQSANRAQQSNVISSGILTQSHLSRQALTICLFHCILISFFDSNFHSSRSPYSTTEMEFVMKYYTDSESERVKERKKEKVKTGKSKWRIYHIAAKWIWNKRLV